MRKLFILLLCFVAIQTLNAQRNIVLIILDDIGSDYFGFQENRIDTVNMPNVRKLFNRGVRFSNAWTNPVCSPTRAGILTGRYSFRTGVGNPVVEGNQLNIAEMTIPKLLKNANAPVKYATANIGKWHLHQPIAANYNNPASMGWDHYAGVFSGAPMQSFTNWAKVTNGVATRSTNYLTTETANDAIDWMSRQANKPFFLWLAFNAPHSPLHLPPDSLITNRTLPGTAADITANPKAYFKVMAEAVDNRIGTVVNWLEANGKLDSTDIIFICDNGNTMNTAQTRPFNRAKSTVYQQGVHIPFIVSGPSVVNPNRVSTALVNVHDLFATILELAGFSDWRSQIAADKPVDSKSLVPILKNTASEARPWAYTEVFDVSTTSRVNSRAIRNTTYKLIYFDSSRTREFYNLITDPTESTNLLNGTLTETEKTNYNYLCTEMTTLLGRSICDLNVSTQQATIIDRPVFSPNPAKEVLWVTNKSGAEFRYEIRNTDGKLVKKGVSTNQISLLDMANGLYLLEIEIQGRVFVEKILVNKP